MEEWTNFVGNAGDKGLDVQLCGTALLTGSISTFETAGGLTQGCPLAQCGVLDVVKVSLLAGTCLGREEG